MIGVKLDISSGTVIAESKDPLQAEGVQNLTQTVEGYLDKNRKLHGSMICASEFPGWENLAAFIDHIRFVRDNHRRIEKVALVIDSPNGKLAPVLSGHFVKAFASAAFEEAKTWLVDQ